MSAALAAMVCSSAGGTADGCSRASLEQDAISEVDMATAKATTYDLLVLAMLISG